MATILDFSTKVIVAVHILQISVQISFTGKMDTTILVAPVLLVLLLLQQVMLWIQSITQKLLILPRLL